MTGSDLRSRALTYLREGKVTVVRADPHEERTRPVLVWAVVQGHYGAHKVAMRRWRWTCHLDLPEGTPDPRPAEKQTECRLAECPHIASVQLVTGHLSAAEKPAAHRGRRAA